MMQLSDKYRPQRVADFAGLEIPRAVFARLAAAPWCSAWLLLGDSGTGKTTMALAIARELGAELHHIPSRECDLGTVQHVTDRCNYIPMIGGGWHLVLVDEADRMSLPAQHAFLSKLDATAWPPQTIFIFTANSTALLEDRFVSRCRVLQFDGAAIADAAVVLLERIWKRECRRKAPDLAALYQRSGNNLRAALMNLELELLAPGAGMFVLAKKPPTQATPDRSAAAHKAWATRRARS